VKRPLITILTDFGLTDHYVGAMKGVILGICPEAQLVDISHEIMPYAVAEGAFTLSQTWRCFPGGTVHLVVVDPGVGSARRPILVEAAGHHFVAPDNGVLTMLYDAVPEYEVREITESRYFRQPASRTFHGRDIFAPVAARIANGLAPAEVGGRIDNPVRLDFARPRATGPKTWMAIILKADRFGNLVTNLDSETWLPRLSNEPFEMRAGQDLIWRLASNYAEMETGTPFVIAGSAGFLEISMNQSSAAELAGLRPGDAVELRLV
jgi:hypothetical protein